MDAETKKHFTSVFEMLSELVEDCEEMQKGFDCLLKTLIQQDSSFHQRWSAHIETMNLVSGSDSAVKTAATLRRLRQLIQQLKDSSPN